jgi:hypothetical protein
MNGNHQGQNAPGDRECSQVVSTRLPWPSHPEAEAPKHYCIAMTTPASVAGEVVSTAAMTAGTYGIVTSRA